MIRTAGETIQHIQRWFHCLNLLPFPSKFLEDSSKALSTLHLPSGPPSVNSVPDFVIDLWGFGFGKSNTIGNTVNMPACCLEDKVTFFKSIHIGTFSFLWVVCLKVRFSSTCDFEPWSITVQHSCQGLQFQAILPNPSPQLRIINYRKSHYQKTCPVSWFAQAVPPGLMPMSKIAHSTVLVATLWCLQAVWLVCLIRPTYALLTSMRGAMGNIQEDILWDQDQSRVYLILIVNKKCWPSWPGNEPEDVSRFA